MPSYTVNVSNRTNFARTDVVTVGVPFAQGEVTSASTEFAVVGARTSGGNRKAQWYPQGPRFLDNSYKYGRFSCLVDLNANETKAITFTTSASFTADPFVINNSVTTSILLSNVMNVKILQSDHYFNLTNCEVVEGGNAGDAYKRLRKFERHPVYPEIWNELTFDIINGADHIRFWLTFGFCYAQRNLGTTLGQYAQKWFPGNRNANGVFNSKWDAPMIAIWGPKSTIYYEDICTVERTKTDNSSVYHTMDPITYSGLRQDRLTWGSVMPFKGVMVVANKTSNTANAVLTKEVFAISTNWYPNRMPSFYASRDYPNYVTDPTDGATRLQSMLTSFDNTYIRPDSFSHNPWGVAPETGGTGSQGHRGYGFGAARGWPMIRTANPMCQESIQFGTRTNFYRPNFFREIDGTWWKYTNYPGVHMFGGTVFWTSTNTMGLGQLNNTGNDLEIDSETVPRSRYINLLHYGPDRQHGLFIMPMFDALTTMDYLSILFMTLIGETYQGMQDINSPNVTIASPDSPRGIGRSLQTLCQSYEITGDSDTLQTIEDRVKTPIWGIYTIAAPTSSDFPDRSRFLEITDPGLQLGLLQTLKSWRPWESCIAVIGLVAAYKLLQLHSTDSIAIERAIEMADKVAGSVVLHATIDCRSTIQNIVVGNWTGILNDWKPDLGITITGSNGATGTIWHIELVGTVFGPTSGNTTVTSAPLIRMYLENVTGSFETGTNVTTSTSRTANILFKNYEIHGVTAIHNGDNLPDGRGALIPQSLRRVLTNIKRQDSKPFGDGLYFIPFRDYGLWHMPAAAHAMEAAYNNRYTSQNATILSLAADYIEFGLSIGDSNPPDWNEEWTAQCILHPINYSYSSSGNKNADVIISLPVNPYVSAKSVTITATIVASVTINISSETLLDIAVGTSIQVIAISVINENITINSTPLRMYIRDPAPHLIKFNIINAQILPSVIEQEITPPGTIILLFNNPETTQSHRIIQLSIRPANIVDDDSIAPIEPIEL